MNNLGILTPTQDFFKGKRVLVCLKLSLVLPVFNTGYCLDELHQKLIEAIEQITLTFADSFILDHEFVYVEDCGSDQAWIRLTQMAASDPRVRAFRHLQNYGQHAAIATGLAKAEGDLVVVMDADGRDPPAVIAELLDSYFAGHEVVIGVRRRISGRPLRRVCSFVVRRFFPIYERLPNGKHYGSLWLIAEEARMRYLADPDRFRFSLKVLERIPVSIGFVDYDQVGQGNEKSSYSLSKLFKLFFRLLPEKILRRWSICSTSGVIVSSMLLAVCWAFGIEPIFHYSLLALLALFAFFTVGALTAYVVGTFRNDRAPSIAVVESASPACFYEEVSV